MAPEILENKGYNYLVDLWALGVLLYNVRSAEYPIADDEDDPYHVYKLILRTKEI